MDDITFSWDEKKNKANLKKHGVSFEEARTVFADEFGRLTPTILRMRKGLCYWG